MERYHDGRRRLWNTLYTYEGLMLVSNRVMKTIIYRLSASALAQIISWVIFWKIEINAMVLLADVIQMIWYYFYEGLWRNKNENIVR